MDFRIADTFTDSLSRLTGDEKKAVKTTAFDLQLNPANPGMSFHRIERARDDHFWSVRVSSDIRLIVHKTDKSLLLCYVNHHDKAYAWAERRKLETHPRTGAAQLVELREIHRDIVVHREVQADPVPQPLPRLFTEVSDEELLMCGVPTDWIEEVRQSTADTILELADHLPSEAAEFLLELATGGKPEVKIPVAPGLDPFAHPDAQRRFRVMNDVEELTRALDYPWEKWTVFLHPAQRQAVERSYDGPARISGSAGTGKTIVALHRAVFLARVNPDARVLLCTFSETLANALRTKLRRLISNEPRLAERLEVHSIDSICRRLFRPYQGGAQMVSQSHLASLLNLASVESGPNKFSLGFLMSEWEQVVDAWQLDSWESYRDVKRLGRKTRLLEKQRAILWSIFDRVRLGLLADNLLTDAGMFNRLAAITKDSKNPPYEYVVVDEAQDIGVAQLRFLSALGGRRSDGLFFVGDLGQRIFQQPFSWLALGIDIRGRARNLRVNYRTSHQIRMQADRLLGPQVSDADGNVESRGGTISVFNGPTPSIEVCASQKDETDTVSKWIIGLGERGVLAHEIGVFVRSASELERARTAVLATGIAFKVLDETVETTSGQLSICTMHLAKGLEFRAVAVMACDDEIIPLQERIESIADDADLEEVYNTERHLLYVACTRARDHLLVTSVAPASEFLEDIQM